jgi:hypothetical protein
VRGTLPIVKIRSLGNLLGHYADALGVAAEIHKFNRNPSLQTGAGVVYEGLKVAINKFGFAGHAVTKTLFVLEQAGLIGPGRWNPTERELRKAMERLETFGAEQEAIRQDKLSEQRVREFTYNLYRNDVSVPGDDMSPSNLYTATCSEEGCNLGPWQR